MNTQNKNLTPERLEDALKTLFAIDELSGKIYVDKYEKEVRKIVPHSESEAIEKSQDRINAMIQVTPLANANGIKAISSVFFSLLQFCNMEKEMQELIKKAEHHINNNE